jgi:hypothetical protein
MVKYDRAEGIRLIENSINYGFTGQTRRSPEEEVSSYVYNSKDIVEMMRSYAREKIKKQKGVVLCPRCRSRNTNYKQYSVVMSSDCLTCNDCTYLWAPPDLVRVDKGKGINLFSHGSFVSYV